jgi:hypothetical protein
MSGFKLKTPVAFLIFNRPDTTNRVFERIAQAQPSKLLVVGDGPRPEKIGETEKVTATRAIIKRINWPCEVITNYSDINLGCKTRVSTGIDWVFEQVEEAIILEDDCLPHPDFFRFCEELLEYYRYDTRVSLISGTNYASDLNQSESYYFSRYPAIWGWATWKRVWLQYDVEMKSLHLLRKDEKFRHSFMTEHEHREWMDIFAATKSGKVNTWDAQLSYMALINHQLSIYPCGNLISNIGFRHDATHTTDTGSASANLNTTGIQFPLIHPQFILRNYDLEDRRKLIESPKKNKMRGFITRVVNFIFKILA